jgi:hypothetical protein
VQCIEGVGYLGLERFLTEKGAFSCSKKWIFGLSE